MSDGVIVDGWRIHTMEDDDDEENFEIGVYGQGEANQDAKKQALLSGAGQ